MSKAILVITQTFQVTKRVYNETTSIPKESRNANSYFLDKVFLLISDMIGFNGAMQIAKASVKCEVAKKPKGMNASKNCNTKMQTDNQES